MAQMGRPRLPSNVKRLKGTYRAADAPRNEPQPETRIPNRPSWLGKAVPWGREAVREWDRVTPLLSDLNLLSDLDRANLAAYCDAYARWWHWRREIAKHGAVQITGSGYAAQRPEVTMMNQALKDMQKYSALFGFSPADRTRISAEKPDDGKQRSSPFAAFG